MASPRAGSRGEHSSSRSQQNPPLQLHWAELADCVFKENMGYPGVLFADSSVRQRLMVAGNGGQGLYRDGLVS